ncbi:hypothetical protein ACX80D_15205 [Arthrobacter sp. Sr24]
MATPPKIPGLGAFTDHKSGPPIPATPRFVTAAAWFLCLAAVMQLLASVFAIMHAVSPERRAVLEAQHATMAENGPSLEALQNIDVLTVVLSALVTAGAYALFSFYLVKGKSWARMGAGILVALTLIQLVGVSYPEGFSTLAQVICGVLAIALCYLPDSSKFFAAVKSPRS